MKESMIFPREEKTEILFQKILEDPWACEKLQETFCNSCLCGEETDEVFSPDQFSKALFTAYRNRDLSAFLMEICRNTMFDLLRNACLIPYRFDADGIKNPVIMTDGQGRLLLEYSSVAHEKEYRHFEEVYQRLGAGRKCILQRLIDTVIVMTAIWKWNSRFLKKIQVY